MKELQIKQTDITIRPSAIDVYLNCSYKWAKTYLEGVNGIPNARASIGTSIHAGAEFMWNDAIKSGVKDLENSAIIDCAVEKMREEHKTNKPQYDDGEDLNTAEKEVIGGTKVFMNDIAPFTKIPVAVEKYFSVNIEDHPVISKVGGTIDYLGLNTIADIKTSKRKLVTQSYKTQQSTYKFLAESHNLKIEHTLIQGVILPKKDPYAEVASVDIDVEQAKYFLNSILDIVEFAAKGMIPLELLFKGNPKYYLCSPKYCALYNDCPFVHGEIKTTSKEVKKAIVL